MALADAISIPADCVRTSVLDQSWVTSDGSVALDAHVSIDLWSDEPNDLEDPGLSHVPVIIRHHSMVSDWHTVVLAPGW